MIPSTQQQQPPQQPTPPAAGIVPSVVMVPPPTGTSNVVKVHQIAKLRSVLEVAEDFLGQGLVRIKPYLANTLSSPWQIDNS